jgi:hypothetical protein
VLFRSEWHDTWSLEIATIADFARTVGRVAGRRAAAFLETYL